MKGGVGTSSPPHNQRGEGRTKKDEFDLYGAGGRLFGSTHCASCVEGRTRLERITPTGLGRPPLAPAAQNHCYSLRTLSRFSHTLPS